MWSDTFVPDLLYNIASLLGLAHTTWQCMKKTEALHERIAYRQLSQLRRAVRMQRAHFSRSCVAPCSSLRIREECQRRIALRDLRPPLPSFSPNKDLEVIRRPRHCICSAQSVSFHKLCPIARWQNIFQRFCMYCRLLYTYTAQ
jgi:hypothetical protein